VRLCAIVATLAHPSLLITHEELYCFSLALLLDQVLSWWHYALQALLCRW
jgi:hypothetical protein